MDAADELAKADALVAKVGDFKVGAHQLRMWARALKFPGMTSYQEDLLFAAAVLELWADRRPEIQELVTTMRHARTFITSREKMHPTGVSLYDELLSKLEACS